MILFQGNRSIIISYKNLNFAGCFPETTNHNFPLDGDIILAIYSIILSFNKNEYAIDVIICLNNYKFDMPEIILT